MYAVSREARKLRAHRFHRLRNGGCEGCRALLDRGLEIQAILGEPVSKGGIRVIEQIRIDLLGLSGTHQVNATEIKDGKIWISDTLRQLQSDWIVNVPRQIHAAIVAPKL
jgi:hypothetical protein